jgi:hypothetical protein
MMIAWGAKVSPLFRLKASVIAQRIGADPSALMAAMKFESNFNPAARNSSSGAVGLIQFMPNGSVKELGTTAQALAAMTAEEQLDYVERYFVERGYAGQMKTVEDLYMAILWPAAIGKPNDYVLMAQDAGSRAYLQNKGLDLDKDGRITKAEAAARVIALLADGLRPENVADSDTQPAAPIEDRDLSGIPPRVETPTLEESTMPEPSVGDAVQGVATAINPIAGLGVSLVRTLINAFEPLARDKIAAEVARHDDKPEVIQAFTDGVLNATKQITGMVDPVEAVVTARASPQMLAQVQQQALMKLDELQPYLDKISEYEAAARTQDEASHDAASKRDGTAALRDVLAKRSFYMFLTVFAIVGTLLGVQMWFDAAHKPDPMLATFLVSIGMIVANEFKKPNTYAFGTEQPSTAAKVLSDEVASRRPPQ